MCIKRIGIGLLLGLIVVSSTSCLNYYYKQFVVGGKPRYPVHVFYWEDDFSSGIHIDVDPTDEVSFRDSVYNVSISLTRHDCRDGWLELFASSHFSKKRIRYNDTTIELSQDSVVSYSDCDRVWYFHEIILPDTLDTIQLDLRLDYVKEGVSTTRDTTINLFRLEGKKKDMWNF
jgi:hypothetical protein